MKNLLLPFDIHVGSSLMNFSLTMCSFCPFSKSNKKHLFIYLSKKNIYLFIYLFKKNIPKWGNGNKLIICRVNEGHGWEKYPKIGGPKLYYPPHPKPHIFGGFSYYIWRAPYSMKISLIKEKRSNPSYLRVG
jgi:hypothetical protein